VVQFSPEVLENLTFEQISRQVAARKATNGNQAADAEIIRAEGKILRDAAMRDLLEKNPQIKEIRLIRDTGTGVIRPCREGEAPEAVFYHNIATNEKFKIFDGEYEHAFTPEQKAKVEEERKIIDEFHAGISKTVVNFIRIEKNDAGNFSLTVRAKNVSTSQKNETYDVASANGKEKNGNNTSTGLHSFLYAVGSAMEIMKNPSSKKKITQGDLPPWLASPLRPVPIEAPIPADLDEQGAGALHRVNGEHNYKKGKTIEAKDTDAPLPVTKDSNASTIPEE
jgi:hypothetical protein